MNSKQCELLIILFEIRTISELLIILFAVRTIEICLKVFRKKALNVVLNMCDLSSACEHCLKKTKIN